MKKTWLFFLTVVLAFSVAMIGCGGGDGGEEGDDPGTLPDTLELGKNYDGKWLIEGAAKGGSVIVKYPLDASTLQTGDFVKITYTLVSVTPGFKQGNAKFSFDGARCIGEEAGHQDTHILGGWYQSWNDAAKIQDPGWDGTVENLKLEGSYEYKITAEDIAANNTAAENETLNPDGELEVYPESEWVGFYFDNPLSTLADGAAVSFIIKDLKIEAEDVTLYTVTFNANGGAEEPVVFQARGGQPVAATKIPTFTFEGKAFYGWVTDSTQGADSAVDPAASNITADTMYYALWGTTTKTAIASGTGSIKAGEADPSSDIPVATLQAAAATATLEITLSVPASVYPGDSWGLGALLDGVGGWGENLYEIGTPNPGPSVVDGKQSWTFSKTVAEVLAAIGEKNTSSLKINGWGILQDAALEWSIDIVTFTIE